MNSINLSPVEEKEKDNQVNFKKLVRDMLLLLRTSLEAETVSMHWVNPRRDQFVLASYSSSRRDVVFQDRVSRDKHFLNHYSSIKSVTRLEKNTHFKPEQLAHYTGTPPTNYIYLVPFVFHAETVAITVVETTRKPELTPGDDKVIVSYQKVLGRMLQSYQDIADLTEKQTEWTEYDQMVQVLTRSEEPLELAATLVDQLQLFLGDTGGVVLLARGLEAWHTVYNSVNAKYPPPVGLELEQGSIAARALSDGQAFFSPHFNGNPKRISRSEPLCYGSTLAVPVMHRQRRQLLVLVYTENPLLFSDALKHKVGNLCRMAGLKLEAKQPDLDVYDNLFATRLSTYSRDLFGGTLSRISQHARKHESTLATWVGMVTIGNINDLRTRYRLEDLNTLQRHVLSGIRPQKYGIPGIIAAHSDYVYLFLLQSTDESAFLSWTGRIRETFRDPVPLSMKNGELVQLNTGVTRLNGAAEPDVILQKIKKAMNDAINQKKFVVEV
jgi:hypothetical protein